MDYSNLFNKTPLDFTSDKKILKKLGLNNPLLLEHLPNLTRIERCYLFIGYNEIIEDDALSEAIEEQFSLVPTYGTK